MQRKQKQRNFTLKKVRLLQKQCEDIFHLFQKKTKQMRTNKKIAQVMFCLLSCCLVNLQLQKALILLANEIDKKNEVPPPAPLRQSQIDVKVVKKPPTFFVCTLMYIRIVLETYADEMGKDEELDLENLDIQNRNLEQWFPTEVPRHSRVPCEAARQGCRQISHFIEQ